MNIKKFNEHNSVNIQKLLCAEGVFDALEHGKTVTIRLGRRDILLGELLFESTELKRQEIVDVTRVEYCKLRDVRLEDLKNDGFYNHTIMLEQMKNFYPNITFNSEVTVINFEVYI